MRPISAFTSTRFPHLRSAPFILGARKLNESAKDTVEQVRVPGVERRASPLGQRATGRNPECIADERPRAQCGGATVEWRREHRYLAWASAPHEERISRLRATVSSDT
jgi:hypothetical protein